MKWRTVFKDESLWALLIINAAIIAHYLYFNTGFKTLVWIYWAQSVLIGFFTFLNLVTLKDTGGDKRLVPSALFFAVHFGFFHLGYFVFIFIITDLKEAFDWRLFEFSVGAFFLEQLWSFIRSKQREHATAPDVRAIFFLPYLRIVPMHLTILLPFFCGFLPRLGLFLVLKMFADLLMHVLTTKIYGNTQQQDPTVLQ